ncbi:MAG: hypothetical protein R3F60_33395 [bacterium]
MERPEEKTGRAKKGPEFLAVSPRRVHALMTWIVNKSQVDQILQNLKDSRPTPPTARRHSVLINRFLSLLNKFLKQTEKEPHYGARFAV